MKMLIRTVVIFSCLVVLPTQADTSTEGLKEFGKAVFSEVERKLILAYYDGKYGSRERDDRYQDDRDDFNRGKKNIMKHKRRGHSKGLPRGIAKKLERGGPLPPGLAKKQLSTDLRNLLPPVRAGFERAEIDGEVVLIEIASQRIADVIERSAKNVSQELFDADR